jgi:hypothetical protein
MLGDVGDPSKPPYTSTEPSRSVRDLEEP